MEVLGAWNPKERNSVSGFHSDKDMQREVLDVNRAAAYLGVSTSFIHNLVAPRSLVHYKPGGRVTFNSTDLDQFVDASAGHV
jgi:excisionase family DNA binding protein